MSKLPRVRLFQLLSAMFLRNIIWIGLQLRKFSRKRKGWTSLLRHGVILRDVQRWKKLFARLQRMKQCPLDSTPRTQSVWDAAERVKSQQTQLNWALRAGHATEWIHHVSKNDLCVQRHAKPFSFARTRIDQMVSALIRPTKKRRRHLAIHAVYNCTALRYCRSIR